MLYLQDKEVELVNPAFTLEETDVINKDGTVNHAPDILKIS